MLKNNERFLEVARKREEVEEIAREKINKLKNNTYFTNLLENRKKIKELTEKKYKLEVELNTLRNSIEDAEQEEGYQVNLQGWSTPITIDSFKHSFNEYHYYEYNLDYWQFFSPLVDISINLKERKDLKVRKFELTSHIKDVKNPYEKIINSEVEKFKTKEEALKRVEELKQALFNKYAEEFAELNQNIPLANAVKAEFKDVERSYLSNDLQYILKKAYK